MLLFQIDNSNSRLIVEYIFNLELDDEFIVGCNQVKSLVFNNYISINLMNYSLNKFSYDQDKRSFWRGSRFNKEI